MIVVSNTGSISDLVATFAASEKSNVSPKAKWQKKWALPPPR